MTVDELNAFFGQAFAHYDRTAAPVMFADGQRAVVRHRYEASQLRPGGTLSGPTMMGLADMSMYALVLSAIGKTPLAVTTNLSINFLRKPPPADLVAEARMLKLGKALAVGDVIIKSVGSDDPVAHAVVTYSIPPQRSA
jgi:acyl-coenzyme A thioesterase PaaI-like protein